MSGALPIVAGVLGGVSKGIEAFGIVQQGRAQAAALERNAQQAEYEAQYAEQAAAAETAAFRRRFRRQQGANRAAIGAAGGTFSGSALLALADDAAEAELEALTIRHAGTLAAARARSSAATDRWQARQVRSGVPWQVGARLLTGAGELFQAAGGTSLFGG